MITRAFQICLLTLMWSITAHSAAAGACPDYFRFVDFGTQDANGALIRGGPIFRIEQDDRSLLRDDTTTCLDVGPVFTDGHNQPMPVVNTIGYAPALVDPALTSLSVTRITGGAQRASDANAMTHEAAKTQDSVEITNGADHLCVSLAFAFTKTISCEVANPFDPTFPLVIYCADGDCTMTVMAIDDDIVVSADWSDQSDTPQAVGAATSDTVDGIHSFIFAQMSR